MTDQTMPADKVEKIAASMRAAMRRDDPYYSDGAFLEDMSGYIRDLEDLLPNPPLPTLKDMTEEERAACQWMQCDAGPYGRRGLIIKTGEWAVYVADKETGVYSNYSPDLVTALPDLPRMEWNGTEKDEDANTVKVGDVIESADDPRISTLPVGSILLDCDGETVSKRAEAWEGIGYTPIPEEGGEFGPWTVVYIPKEADQ